jgi:hypothetical protein
MTSTHPRDEDTTQPSGSGTTAYSDVDRDGRPDYSEDRTTGYRDDRTDYRDDTMTRREPVYHESFSSDIPTRKVRETKPAFLTTEFWFAAGGIAALIVIYLVEDDPSLDLFRTALLATLIGVAYIVSRGLAKAGSRTTRQPEDPRLVVGNDVR